VTLSGDAAPGLGIAAVQRLNSLIGESLRKSLEPMFMVQTGFGESIVKSLGLTVTPNTFAAIDVIRRVVDDALLDEDAGTALGSVLAGAEAGSVGDDLRAARETEQALYVLLLMIAAYLYLAWPAQVQTVLGFAAIEELVRRFVFGRQ
jgi:hypothetical protein